MKVPSGVSGEKLQVKLVAVQFEDETGRLATPSFCAMVATVFDGGLAKLNAVRSMVAADVPLGRLWLTE